MDSKGKFYSTVTLDKGTDEIGLSQPSGPIQGETGGISGYTAATPKTGRSDWADKLAIYVGGTGAALLKKGDAIRLANTDAEHTGLTRVLDLSGSYAIVNKDFSSGATAPTGMWFKDGGAGAWDAFIPIGGGASGPNITMTFWDSSRQGGSPTAGTFEEGKVYVMPGVIKTIQITAGNLKLIRSATTRPFGKDAQ